MNTGANSVDPTGAPIVLPVRITAGSRVIQTTTRVLSARGTSIRCLEPPPVGERVVLRFYLPGQSAAVEVSAIVREVYPGGAERGCWAEFVDVDPAAAARLLAAINPASRQVRAGPVPLGSVFKRRPISSPQLPAFPAAGGSGLDGPAPVSRHTLPAIGSASRPSLPSFDAVPPAGPHAGPPPIGDVYLAGDTDNRRVFPRYRARFAVRFQTVQDFVLEYAANLSAGGVFVSTDHPPEMSSVITVSLELPGGGPPVTCKALVVHRVTVEQAPTSDMGAGVGVQFLDADDAFRQRIDHAIEQILAERQET
jgi:uncharacterized protein (TIGR02266 family)